MKRIFSLLLALCMVIGLLPGVAVIDASATVTTRTIQSMKGTDYEMTLTATSDGATVSYTKNQEVEVVDETTGEAVLNEDGTAQTEWVQVAAEVTDETTDEWNAKYYYDTENSRFTLILKGVKVTKSCTYAFGLSTNTSSNGAGGTMVIRVTEDSYFENCRAISSVVGGAYRWGHTYIYSENDATLYVDNTAKTGTNGIHVMRNLTIDANLNIKTMGNADALKTQAADSTGTITINGGNINITANRTSASGTYNAIEAAYGVVINGGNLTLNATYKAIVVGTTITIAEDLCYKLTDSAGTAIALDSLLTAKAVVLETSKEHTNPVTTESENAAGCETEGSKTVTVTCGDCGCAISETTETIPATGHTWSEAACGETSTCSACGLTQAKEHTASEAVKENATDTAYDKVVYCADCGAELSRETITLQSATVKLWGTEVTVDTDEFDDTYPSAYYWVNVDSDVPTTGTEDSWNYSFTIIDGRPTVSLKDAVFSLNKNFLTATCGDELELKYEGTNNFLKINSVSFMDIKAATANKGHFYLTGAEGAVLNVKGNGYSTTTISFANKVGGLTISGGEINLGKAAYSAHPVLNAGYTPTTIENCVITVSTKGTTGNNVAALAFGGADGAHLKIIDSDITVTTVDAVGIAAGVWRSDGTNIDSAEDIYICGNSNIVVTETTTEGNLTGNYADKVWMGSGLYANKVFIEGGSLTINASNRAIGTASGNDPDLSDYDGYYNMYTTEGGEAASEYQTTAYFKLEPAEEHTTHTNKTVISDEVAASCTVDGSYVETVICTQCGEQISQQTVTVAASGHSFVDGVCSVCGESETPACEHTNVTTSEEVLAEATCTAAGSKKVTVTCECGEILSETTEEIPVLGHTEGEAVTENFVDSDLNNEGSYDSVVYCSVCGDELSRETVTVSVKEGAVAEVNGVKYATVAEAIEAAEEGQTVTLLDDITVTALVNINKAITLELNEKTVSRVGNGAGATVLYVTAAGVTIQNGTVSITGQGNAVWANAETEILNVTVAGADVGLMAYAPVTVDSCAITASAVTASASGDGIRAYNGAVVALCGNTTVAGSASGSAVEVYKGAEVEVTEGAAIADNNIVYGGTLTVYTTAGDISTSGTMAEGVDPEDYIEAASIVIGEYASVGQITLNNENATVTGAENLDVVATVGDKVWYTNGVYVVHNHEAETVTGSAATCTKTGLTEGVKCSVCGDILTAQEEIPVLGHTEETSVTTVDATCTTAGSTTTTVTCSVCGETLSETTEEIPAKGHTEEISVTTVDATCTTAGSTTTTVTCSVCGETLNEATEEIPAKGHTEETSVTTVDATCTTAGSTTTTVTCSVCGETLSETTEEIPAKGHSYADDAATACEICGAVRATVTVVDDEVTVNTNDMTNVKIHVFNITDKVIVDIDSWTELKSVDPDFTTYARSSFELANGTYVLRVQYDDVEGVMQAYSHQITVDYTPAEVDGPVITVEYNGVTVDNNGMTDVKVFAFNITGHEIADIENWTELKTADPDFKTYTKGEFTLENGTYVLRTLFTDSEGESHTESVQVTVDYDSLAPYATVSGKTVTINKNGAKSYKVHVFYVEGQDIADIEDWYELKAEATSFKSYKKSQFSVAESGEYVLRIEYVDENGVSEKVSQRITVA